ncbi:MAG TPA: asparagine synthase (glutamine-hydrolyzing) [Casimicrobiaceae bacterium]|nr:asparagine synthase (glutamine-hydrolyzing) [Casimicrobiaceae bacterium]
MCGIYGTLQLDGSNANPAHLDAFARNTVHRGPDDEGRHVDGPLAMGMRRLSIIDVDGGHQPLGNEDGTLWLVANGEIYNFRELRQSLTADGHHFKTGSDCETLLHLYERDGDDFLANVNGMFAFALWDAKRRRLLIGRDRLGIKPLYLREANGRLTFASEAKALQASDARAIEVDQAALRAYLTLGYVPAPRSIFKGIRKLNPATLAIVENGRISERVYWKLPRDVDASLSESQWIEAVRARLETSVAMQMVSDVPIGAFLSGGVDSSSVVAFMARHTSQVKTYAIGFEGGAAEAYYDELPHARRVAREFGTDHHEIVVRPDVVSLLPRLLWHLDEPVADTAFVTTYLVSEFARRDVTVILSGVGGDELFGGYRRYLGSRYRARLNRVPAPLRRAVMALADRLPADRHSRSLDKLRLARGFLATADLTFDERYRSYLEVFPDAAADALLREPGPTQFDALDDAFAAAPASDELLRMLAVDAATQLPDDLLALTDRMSMAVSLECRVPLLDHELCELAARIPESIKVRDGRLKHVMKEALRGVLPDEILERTKRGFGAPMGAWLKRDLQPMLRDALSRESVERRGWFHHTEIAKLIADHESARIDGTDRLLALLNLELWARLYLDGRDHADVARELVVAA